jgi:hypothetical protein
MLATYQKAHAKADHPAQNNASQNNALPKLLNRVGRTLGDFLSEPTMISLMNLSLTKREKIPPPHSSAQTSYPAVASFPASSAGDPKPKLPRTTHIREKYRGAPGLIFRYVR